MKNIKETPDLSKLLEKEVVENLIRIPNNPVDVRAVNGAPEHTLEKMMNGEIPAVGFNPQKVISYSRKADSGMLDFEKEYADEHSKFMRNVEDIQRWFEDPDIFNAISPYSNLENSLKKELLYICGITFAIFSGTYSVITKSTPRYERNSFSGRMDGAILSCCTHILRSTLSRSQLIGELKTADIYMFEAMSTLIAMFIKGYCSLEQFFEVSARMKNVKCRIGDVIVSVTKNSNVR